LISTDDAIDQAIRDNLGEHFGASDQLCEIFDSIAFDTQYILSAVKNDNHISNLAYFSPVLFERALLQNTIDITTLKIHNVKKILIHKKNALSIKTHFEKNGFPDNEVLLVFLLLSLKANSCFSSISDEIDFILKILDKCILSDTVTILLKTRMASLCKPIKKDKKSISRIALIIGGQFRGFGNNLKKLKDIFKNYNVDIFISTWEKKGGEQIKLQQLYRHFDKECLNYFKTLSNGEIALVIDNAINYRKKLLNSVKEEELYDLFSWADKVQININEESGSYFENMSNEKKMYYHNSYWIFKAGKKKFKEYDLMIKIRPDIDFISFDLEQIFNTKVFSSPTHFMCEDHKGWIFRRWGFGVGDQVIIGQPDVMIPLLNLYNEPYLTDYINSDLFKTDEFKGHMNIGMAAYINGFECIGNEVFKIKFSELPKIKYEELVSFHEKINS
jgi:hypothetical protein